MSEKTIYRKDIDRLFDEGLDLKRLNGKTILVVGATGLIGSCVAPIRNIRAYLLAALYQAPTTIDSYYRAAVRADCGR